MNTSSSISHSVCRLSAVMLCIIAALISLLSYAAVEPAGHTTVAATVGKVSLLAPTGMISTATPTYRWQAAPNATWYYLWVNDASGHRIDHWYTATEVGCPSGSGECAVTPTVTLQPGAGQWWVQAYGASGYGPWSDGLSFTLVMRPVLIAPTGTINNPTPTYRWQAVTGATWYYLWVNDASGNRIKQWYTAAKVGCAGGSGECAITPTVALQLGAGQWWVEAYSPGGYGPWSDPLSFTIQPVLIAPTGTITDTTPTYQWQAVAGCAWYYLWVNDTSGNRIHDWYTAAAVGCGSGTGICTVTPSTELCNGAGQWWVKGYCNGSYGPWSDALSFTVTTSIPTVTLDPPAAGASQLSGHACNIDHSKIKVVIYVLTNQWYVQPWTAAPFTDISADGSWSSYTHPWNSIVVLLVDPANYRPAATKITNPALDPGVLAWTEYPSGPTPRLDFSGRSWGIKVSGDPFDPGPNLWSNDSSVVNVAADGLHLKIAMIDGKWRCGEVYLLESLGYGTYTVQVRSHLDQLDRKTVAAPLFIYAAPNQELDNEYSGAGGLIPSPNNAQFVVQPYNVSGNIVRYIQPSTAQFTSQMEWRADRVTFRTWNGWSTVPAAGDIIQEWTYTGAYIPPPGQERVHINLWLLNGSAPVSGVGDEMVINSFTFQP